MTVDIADFFTTEGETNGVWYEPVVNGRGIGIEFKVLGNSSDKAIMAAETYEKDLAACEKETDIVKKSRMERDALSKRIEVMVLDIRGKDGREILIQGKPLTYSKESVMAILDGSKPIRTELLKAFTTSETFMTKKA